MSILIKGLDMSVFDHQSWDIRRGVNGKWYMVDTNAEKSDGEWHEIVPIPPHGRLGDLDELASQINSLLENEGYGWLSSSIKMAQRVACAADLKRILNAPTIIPAEEDAKTDEDSEPWLCPSCRHYPPSSTDGKPCSQCDTSDVLHSCYDPAEEGK